MNDETQLLPGVIVKNSIKVNYLIVFVKVWSLHQASMYQPSTKMFLVTWSIHARHVRQQCGVLYCQVNDSLTLNSNFDSRMTRRNYLTHLHAICMEWPAWKYPRCMSSLLIMRSKFLFIAEKVVTCGDHVGFYGKLHWKDNGVHQKYALIAHKTIL